MGNNIMRVIITAPTRIQMTAASTDTALIHLQEYKASIVNNKMCVLQFNVQVSLLIIATVPNLKI